MFIAVLALLLSVFCAMDAIFFRFSAEMCMVTDPAANVIRVYSALMSVLLAGIALALSFIKDSGLLNVARFLAKVAAIGYLWAGIYWFISDLALGKVSPASVGFFVWSAIFSLSWWAINMRIKDLGAAGPAAGANL